MKQLSGLILLLTLNSCSYFIVKDRNLFYPTSQVTDSTALLLSGIYANKADSSTIERYSLWQNLLPSRKHVEGWERGSVDLHFIQPTLTARLLIDGKVVATRNIHYKIAQRSVSLRTQVASKFSVGPLVWAIAYWKVILAPTPDGQRMVLAQAGNGAIMILVVPVFPAGGEQFHAYKRLN